MENAAGTLVSSVLEIRHQDNVADRRVSVMNDKEKLVALLREFGVGFKEDEVTFKDEKIIQVVCEQGSNRVGGYGGFLTAFEFELDGTFKTMGAWE